jgi:glycosyltransferase involved in cell wall biosynthesis
LDKKKILVIENAIDITGGLTSIVRSCKALSTEFNFHFLLPSGSRAKKSLLENKFKVLEIPMREIRKDPVSMVTYFPVLFLNCLRLATLVRRHRIDLIVSNDLYNLLPALYTFFGGVIPYVVYVRFLPSKFPKPLTKFWSSWHNRYASATIAVSQAVIKELPYDNNVICIGGELPLTEATYSPSMSNRIVYLANYIKGKGQELALQSFARLHQKYPRWSLRFVGGDMGLSKNRQFKEYLLRLSHDLGLAEKVEWCKFTEDTALEYQGASFLLNFSDSESFSLTCLEAMFYGRPVVATRCGGPEEIVDHESTGILVDKNDITGMANAIEYLITHPQEREEMGRNAYHRVREKFSRANTVEKLAQVYRQALSK